MRDTILRELRRIRSTRGQQKRHGNKGPNKCVFAHSRRGSPSGKPCMGQHVLLAERQQRSDIAVWHFKYLAPRLMVDIFEHYWRYAERKARANGRNLAVQALVRIWKRYRCAKTS